MTCIFCHLLDQLREMRAFSVVVDRQDQLERERQERLRRLLRSRALDEMWRDAMKERAREGLPVVDLIDWVLQQLRTTVVRKVWG